MFKYRIARLFPPSLLQESIRNLNLLLEEEASLLAPANGKDIQDGTATNGPNCGLQELAMGRGLVVKANAYIHTKDAHHDYASAEDKSCCAQHHPHLKQLVLLVIQHDIDVVLCVIHVLPEL